MVFKCICTEHQLDFRFFLSSIPLLPCVGHAARTQPALPSGGLPWTALHEATHGYTLTSAVVPPTHHSPQPRGNTALTSWHL